MGLFNIFKKKQQKSPVVQEQTDIKAPLTAQDIINMAQAKEPTIIYEYDNEGRRHLVFAVSNAVERIIPTFDGGFTDLSTTLILNDPKEMQQRIEASDVDTLLLFFKFLAIEANDVQNKDIIGTVQQFVMKSLMKKLTAQQNDISTDSSVNAGGSPVHAPQVPETKQTETPPDNNKVTNDSSLSAIPLLTLYEKFKDMSNTDKVYGEKIPALITKYKSLYNEKAPDELIKSAFIDLMNEVIRTVYIVPFHYDKEHEFQNDKTIHCTFKASNKFNIESIMYRCQRMTAEQISKLYWTKDNQTNRLTVDLDWWDISRLSGSDGFCFENTDTPRTMYPQTANDGTHNLFLCFTGIDQYLKVFGEDKQMHIGLYTINDIVEYISAAENFSGIVINPDTETHCFIRKEAF